MNVAAGATVSGALGSARGMRGAVSSGALSLSDIAASLHGPAAEGVRLLERMGCIETRGRAGIEQALRTGRVLSRERSRESGINGNLDIAMVRHRDGHAVKAAVKHRNENAAQEEFVAAIARELGVGHRVPAIARRRSGTAYVEYVHAGSHRVNGPDSLLATLQHGYRTTFRRADANAVGEAAAIERSLLQFLDYVVANSDRRHANVIADQAAGRVWWIDNGLAGQGDLASRRGVEQLRLRPVLEDQYLTEQLWVGETVVDLHPAAVEIIRRRLTPARLAELHAGVARAVDHAPSRLQQAVAAGRLTWERQPVLFMEGQKSRKQLSLLRWITSDTYLANMVSRVEHAVSARRFEHVRWHEYDALVETAAAAKAAAAAASTAHRQAAAGTSTQLRMPAA